MINVIRLDERLIHGQVATKWAKAFPIDSLLVVDDDVVKDPLSIKTLQMAAMSMNGIKCFIKGTEEALEILCDQRCAKRKIMVVCRKLDTVLELAKRAPNISEINLGNYGRMMMSETPRTKYFNNLLFNDEETEIAKQISELSYPVYYQGIPELAKTDLKGYFK